MKVVDRKRLITDEPMLIGEQAQHASLTLINDDGKILTHQLDVEPIERPTPLHITWKIPAINIKGTWSSNLLLDKRIRADWELAQLSSSISVDAPVLCLFDHEDQNRLTFSCSDTVHTINLEAGLREEDNHFYCSISFFINATGAQSPYRTTIRIDQRALAFSTAIQDAAEWLINQSALSTRNTPPAARLPLYSTWYSYHQNLREIELLQECNIAKDLGYKVIIVDDGWQTMDDRRGYDYTGDWLPERFEQVEKFVADVHALGMKIMFWFSVPFCGKKSVAYQTFKGKFLTENHPWAPVFDPRFPEVRAHLVSRYLEAQTKWNVDGFKLDFIDDFHIYPETEMKVPNGRDVMSVDDGVQLLICEIHDALLTGNPEVLIEFRQKYISPALRHLGNMFRAFDCPNDSTLNRVRTTDVKLLCGAAAVHSDMITWHRDEPVEIAALQITSILFSVPQLSIRLAEASPEERSMIRFFTNYWLKNREILLDGDFIPSRPLANYPALQAVGKEKTIYGIYDDYILDLEDLPPALDLINGKMSKQLIVSLAQGTRQYDQIVFDCLGTKVEESRIVLQEITALSVPPNGIIQLIATD